MNIDWSKAPEGAEYWCELKWFKILDGEWRVWCPGVNSWLKPAYADPDNFPWWGNAIKRPAVWSGEGLPPVGEIIEWLDGEFLKAVVVGHHQGAVVAVDDDDPRRVFIGKKPCYRPIRTPEQIAAAEREDCARAMIDATKKGPYTKHGISHDAALALFDAGYRKQEQTK